MELTVVSHDEYLNLLILFVVIKTDLIATKFRRLTRKGKNWNYN